jgi:hypothetical protein
MSFLVAADVMRIHVLVLSARIRLPLEYPLAGCGLVLLKPKLRSLSGIKHTAQYFPACAYNPIREG